MKLGSLVKVQSYPGRKSRDEGVIEGSIGIVIDSSDCSKQVRVLLTCGQKKDMYIWNLTFLGVA